MHKAMKNNEFNFTEKEEALAKSMIDHQAFRETVRTLFLAIDPAVKIIEKDALDLYSYGMALKMITLDEKFRDKINLCE